jgi:tRNA dimethylallyltransferase
MPKLVVILGPTGVGKTDLSLELAERWACPIVSADSRQIYRDLPIGTAAPTIEEQKRVKHYFIGIKDLHETYNAGQYARDCKQLLRQLFTQHEQVIMVGGSMMYIDAVCKGLDDIPDIPAQIREQVRQDYQSKGLEWLQAEVQRLDPTYWLQVDQKNPQRLMHCIEVCLASGKPFSEFRLSGFGNREADNEFEVEYIMVERPREELYERINMRVHKMIEAGLIQEARTAFEKVGLLGNEATAPNNDQAIPNSLNTVGYKELLHYFRGEWTLDRAIEMIQQNSRHYAKRQMTWWRRAAHTTNNEII